MVVFRCIASIVHIPVMAAGESCRTFGNELLQCHERLLHSTGSVLRCLSSVVVSTSFHLSGAGYEEIIFSLFLSTAVSL